MILFNKAILDKGLQMFKILGKFSWSILLLPLFFVTPALAAAPDGLGPWADTVVATHQGLRNDGSPVPAIRSNPAAALGIAEQTNADGTFYSLGFGGSITLGFDNGISGGSMIFESTNLPYPVETAKIEFSSNGTKWVTAGSVSRSGTVSQPKGVACAKFVRITDTSDRSLFEPTADGYDVDGVKAIGTNCTPKVKPCDSIATSDTSNNENNNNEDKNCCEDGKSNTNNLTNKNDPKNHDTSCDKEANNNDPNNQDSNNESG